MIFALIFIKHNRTTVGEELLEHYKAGIEKIEVSFYVPFKSPSFVIINDNNINEIMNILNEIKLIPTRDSDYSYDYIPLESYEIIIYRSGGEKNTFIKIYANKYITIDGENFKITSKKDISKIYDVIVIEPQEEKIDEFYYKIDKKY